MTMSNAGIYLGPHFRDGAAGKDVFYRGERHLITVDPTAPARASGSSSANLNPELQLRPRHRSQGRGCRHHCAQAQDPRRRRHPQSLRRTRGKPALAQGHGYNPLRSLDPNSPSFTDDASALAEALIRIQGNEPHWSESAQDLVAALIMWERMDRKDRASLGHVREMLAEPYSKSTDGKPSGLYATILNMIGCEFPPVVNKAGRFMHPPRR